MPLQSGERLGPYAIQSLLGAGGMGEVYRGRDTRLGRDVALKVISSAKAGDAALRRRFEIEARAASALNHPSIVTVYDVGDENGIPWIAMEWVEGQTLRHALGTGPLPLRQSLEVALHVAQGLAAAHAKGIVHRDLKPANVMITPDGRAKILDFGLARLVAHGEDDELLSQTETLGSPGSEATRAGAILGTVGYMSPEQASGRPADARSDQFAFGLIVYEMLTGKRAFDHPTPVETLAAVVRDEPVPLAELRPGIPPRLEGIVATCLAKSPDDRFASSRDLVASLEPIVASSAVLDRPTEPDVDVVLPAPPRRKLGRFAAAAAVAALALAAGIWGWRAYVAPQAVRSLAVLPFEETSDDPASDYLGDGLSDSLIEQLSQLPSLRVMARSTVFRFKGTNDPLGAARGLGVEAVVTGNVSRRAGQVSVSAELVDTRTGARLWGERFDRPFSDLIRLQDMVTNGLVGGLGLRLSDDQKRSLNRYGTRDAEAYDLALHARQLFARDTEEDDLEARQLFNRAIEKDPKFVAAYIGLGSTYVRAAANGWARPADALLLSNAAAEKAAALDPENVMLRATLAYGRLISEWDWEPAAREFREISHDPRLLRGGFQGWALYLWALGRPDESAALLERALRVDPGNPETRINRADYLAAAGRLDDAIAEYRAIVATEPTMPSPLYGLADALERKGDVPAAIAALRKAYELSADDRAAAALATARTASDLERVKADVARSHLDELERLARERYVSPLDVARLQAQLGERDKAFESLDAALRERSPGLILLKVDRAWDKVRDDPRFARIVKHVGIP